MSDVSTSYGRLVAQASTDDALLLEHQATKDARFKPLDQAIEAFIRTSLGGVRVAAFVRKKQYDEMRFEAGLALDEALRETFRLERQQALGAWYLPDFDSVRIDGVNVPYYLKKHGRFANTGMAMSVGRVNLSESPEALFAWAILEPAFEVFFRPFLLRGADEGSLSRDEKKQAWADVDRTYADLRLNRNGALKFLRYGAGWSKLAGSDRLSLKVRLLDELSAAVTPDTSRRLRMVFVQLLVRRFYDASKRRNATMRSVLKTRTQRRILAGCFRGDWMEFLSYIDEKPSPVESISTALPKPTLYVEAADKAERVARERGLPIEEVNRMLAAFWAGANDVSPVTRRVATMKRFWGEFEALHTRQRPGMPSLWGLIETSRGCRLHDPPDPPSELPNPNHYEDGLYLRLLPESLLNEIRSLWGTFPSEKWPERLVTEPNSYALMIEAFGPAIRLWQGCALTAWFLCESGLSRTDMRGLAAYHERELTELAGLKSPVPQTLFEELIAAESRLGERVPIPGPEPTRTVSVQGVTFEFSTSSSSRRAGFEMLRDIVNRYRRDWAEKNLDHYLRAIWETEIRGSATRFYRQLEIKGQKLTPGQILKCCERAADHWFGGSLRDLLGAFGESGLPLSPYKRVLPLPAERFAEEVLRALGGRPTRWRDIAATIQGNDRQRQDEEWRAYNDLKRLAEYGVHFVQRQEALGREPTVDQFGRARFEALRHRISSPDIETAWAAYVTAVRTALSRTSTSGAG